MNRRETLFALLALVTAAGSLAQPAAKAPRIALVDTSEQTVNMAEGRNASWGALLSELRRLGYVEGTTIIVERWSGGGDTRAYEALARKVVASRPDVIFARGRTMTVPIAAATKEIPIVANGTIPAHLYLSFAHPGKNVTGIHFSSGNQQIYTKQIEFLREVTKANARIVWLGTRTVWDGPVGEAARLGARQAKLALEPMIVESPVDDAAIKRAFAVIAAGKFEGICVSPATELDPHRATIAALALAARLPSMGRDSIFPEAGILMSYGTVDADMFRKSAHLGDKILKGARPGDLPIEQPSKIELVVNARTAKALGIKIPQSILVRADRLIE